MNSSALSHTKCNQFVGTGVAARAGRGVGPSVSLSGARVYHNAASIGWRSTGGRETANYGVCWTTAVVLVLSVLRVVARDATAAAATATTTGAVSVPWVRTWRSEGSRSPRTGFKLGRRQEWQVLVGVCALTARATGALSGWRRWSRDERRERKVGGDSGQMGRSKSQRSKVNQGQC